MSSAVDQSPRAESPRDRITHEPTSPQLAPTHALFGVATLMAFAFVVLLPYLHGHWRLADDAYQSTLPNHLLQQRIIANGEWPQWNLNVGLGQPWTLGMSSSLFYPLQILWGLVVGWSEVSLLWYVWLHLFIGGLLALQFTRRAGLSFAGSLFSAIAWVGNGYALGILSNPSLLVPAMWWPLLLTGLLELHTHPGRERWTIVKIGLAVFLIETGGYPLTKIMLFTATGLGYLLMARRDGGWIKGPRWTALAIAGAGAFLASAPEWVSTIRTMPFSDRFGTNIYDDYTYNAPSNFFTLGTTLLPTVFLKRGMQLGMYWLERSWWMGSLTVLVVLWAAYARVLPWHRLRVAAAIALGAFLFSLGGHSFFRELVAFVAPPFEHLRHSNNARIIPMAFLIFVAGAGVTALEERFPRGGEGSRDRHVAIAWAAFLLLCVLAAVSEADNDVHSKLIAGHPTAGWKLEGLHTAFYFLLAYTVFRTGLRLTPAYGWPILLVGLQFLSMADAGYAFRHLTAVRSDEPLRGAEPFAIASPQPNRRSTGRPEDGLDLFAYGGNAKVLNAYNPPYSYLLADAKKDPQIAPLLDTLVSCNDRLVPGHSCQGMRFRIDRYFGNTIKISGNGPARAMIVVHDFWDPHWKARLNGADVPVVPVLRYFKGIEVPRGRWGVRLRYRERMWPVLWLVSAAGFAVLVLAPAFVAAYKPPRTARTALPSTLS